MRVDKECERLFAEWKRAHPKNMDQEKGEIHEKQSTSNNITTPTRNTTQCLTN
jgi:hypothetical protein